MFQLLGQLTTRYIYPILVIWILLLAVTHFLAPPLRDVVTDGEFAFLPETTQSRQAEQLYRVAYPQSQTSDDGSNRSVQQDPLGSNVVIVISREDRPEGLGKDDFDFVNDYLVPGLQEIEQKTSVGYDVVPISPSDAVLPPEERVVRAIWTRDDNRFGPMLDSSDGKSTLIVVELSLELYDRQNQLLLGRIEALLQDPELLANKPLALGLALSGSATVGRDMLAADTESASRTDTATKILVVILLLGIYRAPLLAVVPLMTVGLTVTITMYLLRIFAGLGWVGLFNGLHVYVVVVVYGSGVDYCLFLIARYKEELDRGGSFQQAMSTSVKHVGTALATSAGTSFLGIGMLIFTEFGKFQQAGVAIAFGLFVALCCALTFTPALLVLLGRWLFWPDMRQEKLSAEEGWIPSDDLGTFWSSQRWLERLWDNISRVLQARPATVLLTAILILMPLAIVAVVKFRDLSYGLLSDLPSDRPSVIGAREVQEHFPAGIAGPTTALVILEHPISGATDETDIMIAAEQFSEGVSQAIIEHMDELGISDVRSQHHPLGTSEQAVAYYASIRRPLLRQGIRRQAFKTYVCNEGQYAQRAFRFDFVLNEDPFSRDSIDRINRLETALHEALPADVRDSSEIWLLGSTASIRDLQIVTDGDQVRIYILVSATVCFVLLMMLKRLSICLFLIISVVFNFLVAWGGTYVLFAWLYGAEFAGLDWKVPIYLFTLLLALGVDYNILLLSRIHEEREQHGTIGSIVVALSKTGRIISSCGIIMAGSLASLMSGTLMALVQLGFALSFGIFLDTFVVRPMIVPAWLLLLNSGRLGRIGYWLGAEKEIVPPSLDKSTDPSLNAVRDFD